MKKKNEELNIQIRQLQAVIRKTATYTEKENRAIAINLLGKIFTPYQITILMSSRSRITWSPEDIMSAISLRSLSPKAYKYLRNVRNIPLSCINILNNWVTQFNITPGILHNVINIMSSIRQNLSTIEKLTVLTFDELQYIFVTNWP